MTKWNWDCQCLACTTSRRIFPWIVAFIVLLLLFGITARAEELPPISPVTLAPGQAQMVAGDGPAVDVRQVDFREVEVDGWGSGFILYVQINPEATGHRAAVTHVMEVLDGDVGRMYVATEQHGSISGGNGHVFGSNPTARAWKNAGPAAEIVGMEANTDAQVPVGRKVGIQVGDVATSLHDGEHFSAAILAATLGEAVGWRRGLDLSLMNSFTEGAIVLPLGPNTGKIVWGDSHIWSDGQSLAIKSGEVQMNIEGGEHVVLRKGEACWYFDWTEGTHKNCG